MPDDVKGNAGDISGHMGDISSHMGDVSGHMGDVSGHMGDISGRTFAQIQGLILQGRQAERIMFVESKINRLEYELFAVAQSLDARLRAIEERLRPPE